MNGQDKQRSSSAPTASPPASPPASAWQRFYSAVLRRRRQRATGTAEKLPRPVVSIGNLHWGGGGKTPITAAVARHLRDCGHRVVILSRGHGRTSKGPLVVSRGQGPEVSTNLSGDEPALLARIAGVAVVVGERRFAAGMLALETMPCDIFLLDDGFSHVRLARDLELLLFPAAAPLGGARLLPSGRLREPLTAVQHADAVLLTGVAAKDLELSEAASHHPDPVEQLRSSLAPFGWTGPTFGSSSEVGLANHRAIHRALLVCAVARSGSVLAGAKELARQNGFSLADPLTFRDHHSYPDSSLRKIRNAASKADTILVTGKDLVKLQERLELPKASQLIEILHRAQPQATFFEWLDQRLAVILEQGCL